MILKNWFNFDNLRAQKILDVGCGAGLLTENLVTQNTIWGVDISLSLLTLAKQKGLKTILSSAEALPFKNQDFDIVLCVGVIPYYKEPDKIISEIRRAIKPGGKVVVTSTANSYALRFVRYMKNISGLKSQLEHLYTCEEMEQLLKSEEIRIEDSCIAYGDKIWSFSNGSLTFKQKLFGRATAVLGSAPTDQ
jgi:2-polyprenyl-3-methyl-5-hydroxy-6-metoxy-1,4-benzoquinol methylase